MGFNFFKGIGSTSFDDWLTGAASANASMRATKKYNTWAATNLPKLQMRGYRDANLNPILVGDHSAQMGSISASSGSYGDAMPSLGSLAQGALGIASLPALLKQRNADAQAAKAEAKTAEENAMQAELKSSAMSLDTMRSRIDNAARYSAMTGYDMRPLVLPDFEGNANKSWDRLVEMYRNQIDRGAYESSKGHAVYEDILSGAHSASEFAPKAHINLNRRK